MIPVTFKCLLNRILQTSAKVKDIVYAVPPTRQNMQERVRNAFPDGQETILNNTTILHKPPELCLQQDGGNFDNSLDSFFTFF